MTRSVLITGASSGIGLQLARDYRASGWNVVACGRSTDKLSRLFSEGGYQIKAFDITDQDSTRKAIGQMRDLDLVILNAGDCEYIDDVRRFDAELFHRVISANLSGTANCLDALLPGLDRGSRLVIVSSSVTYLPLPRAEAYGASKAALDYLARTLAVDLKSHGIQVSLVRPGFVDTPLTRKNDFPMPGRISVEKASEYIRTGIERGKSEIDFPPLFIAVMKLLSWLPGALWLQLSAKMSRVST